VIMVGAVPSAHLADVLAPVRAQFPHESNSASAALRFSGPELFSATRRLEALDVSASDGEPALVVAGDLSMCLGRKAQVIYRTNWDDGKRFALIAYIQAGRLLQPTIQRGLQTLGELSLWCLHERMATRPPQPVSAKDLERFKEQVDKAVVYAKSLSILELSNEAQKIWTGVYGSLAEPLAGFAGLVTCNGQSMVLRLAMLYAIYDLKSEIDAVHLRAALTVWRYSRATVEALWGVEVDDPLPRLLLEAIAEKERSKSELHGILNNHTTASRLNEVLACLEARGHVVVEKRKTCGRPETVWRVASAES
jgi:hypothetical protein